MIDEIIPNNTVNCDITSLPDYIRNVCRKIPNNIALSDDYSNVKITFKELDAEIDKIACGLQKLGLKKGDKVSLFSENNARWMISDQAILRNGAIDAVRGSKAPLSELEYILDHSDSVGAVLYDAHLYKNLLPKLEKMSLKFVVTMFSEGLEKSSKVPTYTYEELREKGESSEFIAPKVMPEDEATLIYTSGTTSRPKGVMLTHSNLMSQIENLKYCFAPKPGETYLCILPIWHSYERSVAYFFFSSGTTLIYTNIKNIKSDMTKFQTSYIVGVPRIWESIAANVINTTKNKSKLLAALMRPALGISKINRKAARYLNRADIKVRKYTLIGNLLRSVIYLVTEPWHLLFQRTLYTGLIKKFGIGLKAGIAGGGALAPVHAEFFEALGVNLHVGYGLTETSPVLTINSVFVPNVLYTAGKPIPNTLIKIMDTETMKELPPYKKGVVFVKGPQVMKGYYKDEEATKQVLSEDGWLNTGDLGWMSERNDLVLTGRQKEIIVLSNGENIEPVAIEQTCLKSDFINQIMLVGQDKSALGALVVLNNSAYETYCKENNIELKNKSKINSSVEFIEFVRKEISKMIKTQTHLRSFERISKIAVIDEEFTVQNGMLTMTGKMRRNVISEHYNKLIEEMYS